VRVPFLDMTMSTHRFLRLGTWLAACGLGLVVVLFAALGAGAMALVVGLRALLGPSRPVGARTARRATPPVLRPRPQTEARA